GVSDGRRPADRARPAHRYARTASSTFVDATTAANPLAEAGRLAIPATNPSRIHDDVVEHGAREEGREARAAGGKLAVVRRQLQCPVDVKAERAPDHFQAHRVPGVGR